MSYFHRRAMPRYSFENTGAQPPIGFHITLTDFISFDAFAKHIYLPPCYERRHHYAGRRFLFGRCLSVPPPAHRC